MRRAPWSPTRVLASALFLAGLQALAGAPAAAVVERPAPTADSPTVEPATGGAGVPLIQGHFDDVEAIGYETAEYFLSGDAHSYGAPTPLSPDGRWNDVAPAAATAAYKTRVIVHRPQEAARFDGTVFVEWLNVSGGVDASPDWVHGHLQVARDGAAYVLVSAQAVGVNQLINGGLAPGDPARYGSLVHPGDSYSYDIFSQAGQAVWDDSLLQGLVPQRVVAVGESQSAGRLVTYVNGVHSLVQVYDGFLIHSRQAGGAPLSQAPQSNVPVPPTDIRDDIDTPVLVFQSEGDVANSALRARQPETPDGNFRLWEVPGTAHFDIYGLNIGTHDVGDGQGEVENLDSLQDPIAAPMPGLIECALPINSGPMHWVFDAAVHWMDRWTRWGTPPPIAPRLQALSAPGVSPVEFAVDEHGIVLGGIRTPYVDAPIAKLGGAGNTGAPGAPPISFFCFLFGQTVPFSEEKLAELYPTHEHFLSAYLEASLEAIQSGYLLWPDAIALFRAAKESGIGGPP